MYTYIYVYTHICVCMYIHHTHTYTYTSERISRNTRFTHFPIRYLAIYQKRERECVCVRERKCYVPGVSSSGCVYRKGTSETEVSFDLHGTQMSETSRQKASLFCVSHLISICLLRHQKRPIKETYMDQKRPTKDTYIY